MKTLYILLMVLIPFLASAQAPDSGDDVDLEGVFLDDAAGETSTTLVLDNSRTRVGRDFYDLFYKLWTALSTQADTTLRASTVLATPSADVVILIEEIPSPGMANQILISINDQPVWQQFVQARYDLLETDVLYALETVRQYLATNQEIQQQLGSQDQKGSGVY